MALTFIRNSYFLTQTAILLLYGQILTLFDRKWTYIAAITIFEIGSLLCAVAVYVPFPWAFSASLTADHVL